MISTTNGPREAVTALALGGDAAAGQGSPLQALRPACDVWNGLSAGGVADEWVTQLLRQSDAKVFKKYSQMQLQMKREALQKLNRTANEGSGLVLVQAS